MFYLKASLIISAVSALPLSGLKARQNSQLVSSELIPGSCSWQCGPTIDVASNCASDDESCICTTSAAYQLQYCLSCFVTQSSAGSLQPNASDSSMLTAVEWANNFNSQCRGAGFDLPAVFVEESSALERAVTSTDNGSPAVPRVGSPPSASTPSLAAPAPAPTSSSLSLQTPTESPSAALSSSSSSSPTPTPAPAPSPTPSPTPSSSSGFASVITLGSQTITIATSATPINFPGNNTSDSSSANAIAAAAANTALRSTADVWLAMMVGTLSVIAAVMF